MAGPRPQTLSTGDIPPVDDPGDAAAQQNRTVQAPCHAEDNAALSAKGSDWLAAFDIPKQQFALRPSSPAACQVASIGAPGDAGNAGGMARQGFEQPTLLRS